MEQYLIFISLFIAADIWHDWDQIRQVQGRSRGNHWKAADAFKHGLAFAVAAYAFISHSLVIIGAALFFGACYRWLFFDLGLNKSRGLPWAYTGSVGILDRLGGKLGVGLIGLKVVLLAISIGIMVYVNGV